MERRTPEKLEELSNLAVSAAHGFVCLMMRFAVIKSDESQWWDWLTGKYPAFVDELKANSLKAVKVGGIGYELRWRAKRKQVWEDLVADVLHKAKSYADAFEADEKWLLRRFGSARLEIVPPPREPKLEWDWEDPRDAAQKQFGLNVQPAVGRVHGMSVHGFVYSLCTQFAQNASMFRAGTDPQTGGARQSRYSECFLALILDDRLEELLLHNAEEPHLNHEFAVLLKLLPPVDTPQRERAEEAGTTGDHAKTSPVHTNGTSEPMPQWGEPMTTAQAEELQAREMNEQLAEWMTKAVFKNCPKCGREWEYDDVSYGKHISNECCFRCIRDRTANWEAGPELSWIAFVMQSRCEAEAAKNKGEIKHFKDIEAKFADTMLKVKRQLRRLGRLELREEVTADYIDRTLPEVVCELLMERGESSSIAAVREMLLHDVLAILEGNQPSKPDGGDGQQDLRLDAKTDAASKPSNASTNEPTSEPQSNAGGGIPVDTHKTGASSNSDDTGEADNQRLLDVLQQVEDQNRPPKSNPPYDQIREPHINCLIALKKLKAICPKRVTRLQIAQTIDKEWNAGLISDEIALLGKLKLVDTIRHRPSKGSPGTICFTETGLKLLEERTMKPKKKASQKRH